MNKTLKKTAGALAVIAALSTSQSAHAITYTFSDSETTSFADIAAASLTIENITGGTQWTLTGLYDAAKYPSAFLKNIKFDYAAASNRSKKEDLVGSNVQVLKGDIIVKTWDNDGVSFNTANNSGRFVSSESLSWVYQNTTSGQFSNLVAHVNSINGGNSVKFAGVVTQASVVPEPSTWMMLGLGLLGLAAVARRRSGNVILPAALAA